MKREKTEWEMLYENGDTPWDAGAPDPILQKFDAVIRSSKTALDIGCGTGNESIYLASLGISVLGIDLSDSAIEKAREKGEEALLTRRLIFTPQNFLEFQANVMFDLALDRRVFHFLDPTERMIYVDKLVSLLVPGGHLILIVSSEYEPGDSRYHFTVDQLVEIFSPGLSLLDSELVTIETHGEKPQSHVCLFRKEKKK